MNVSDTCIEAIKEWEGFRPDAYTDVVGVWTIGYGNTLHVKAGDTITEAVADVLLREHVAIIAGFLAAHPPDWSHGLGLTQGQTDALASFAFNLGLRTLRTSTLWELLNAGQLALAALEFPKWCHAGGKVYQGLVQRRAVEQRWFTETLSALPAPLEPPQ